MKTKRPGKRFWLFIVEGKTEIEALNDVVEKYIHNIDANIEVLFLQPFLREDLPGGDILQLNMRVEKIALEIEKKVIYYPMSEFMQMGLEKKDIERIIQITDTDGVFVPDEHVISMSDEQKKERPELMTYYTEDTINVMDVKGSNIVDRNHRKSDNLRYLRSIDEIKIKSKKYPYRIYYFSNNIDCYISGEYNERNNNKVEKAMDFAKKIEGCEGKFGICFGDNRYSLYCTQFSYDESWEEIQRGTNSLKRGTNFNLFFCDAHEWLGK